MELRGERWRVETQGLASTIVLQARKRYSVTGFLGDPGQGDLRGLEFRREACAGVREPQRRWPVGLGEGRSPQPRAGQFPWLLQSHPRPAPSCSVQQADLGTASHQVGALVGDERVGRRRPGYLFLCLGSWG